MIVIPPQTIEQYCLEHQPESREDILSGQSCTSP